jgi:hypothetical protein
VLILFGVALVVWELQQTRELAKAQLTSENLVTREQTLIAMLGENPMDVLAKTCPADDSLSFKEFRIVTLYFQSRLLETIRRIEIGKASQIYSDDDWEEVANLEFSGIFQSEYGRFWWRSVRQAYLPYQPELVSFADQLLAKKESPNCRAFYNLYKEAFGKDA